MSNWKKTKCCGTCEHWDIQQAATANGRITNNPAPCKYPMEIKYPSSIPPRTRPTKPNWMCRDYGADCQCHSARNPTTTKEK